MSTLEKVQLLEERIKKAIVLIEKLKTENATLKDEVELLQMHNDELKSYNTDSSKTNRLIEEGISNALTQLDHLENDAVRRTQEEAEEAPEEDFSFETGEHEEDLEADSDDSYTAPDEENKDEPLY